jgi:biotin operon repressor
VVGEHAAAALRECGLRVLAQQEGRRVETVTE